MSNKTRQEIQNDISYMFPQSAGNPDFKNKLYAQLDRINHGKEPICTCGKGRMSVYDLKCGGCRTNSERKTHEFRLRNDGWYSSFGSIVRQRWKQAMTKARKVCADV